MVGKEANQANMLFIIELSDSVFYSERHLNRIFDQYVGRNTKTFSRLVRVNQSVRLLGNPQNTITNAGNMLPVEFVRQLL